MTDFLETPPTVQQAKADDWWAFRRKHPFLFIARTGEDGSQADWQALLREVGSATLSAALHRARQETGKSVNLSTALAALETKPPETAQEVDPRVRQESKRDLLIWCLCHGASLYADAVSQWKDGGEGYSSEVYILGRKIRFGAEGRIRVTPQDKYDGYVRMADEAATECWAQYGHEPDRKHKPALYAYVKASRPLRAWLRAKRLIP